MIVLFDCNCYDKLITLSDESLQQILNKITKVILPQIVREQLDQMIESENKIERLSHINQIIARLHIANKLEKTEGLFDSESSEDDTNVTYFKSLPDKMIKGDKEIALTAKQNNAIMITNDIPFLNGLHAINQKALNFEDFLRSVNICISTKK